MKIKFSMDGIKNLDLLYTWNKHMEESLGFEVQEEHYHGTEYCKAVIRDVIKDLRDIKEDNYIGQIERIAKVEICASIVYIYDEDNDESCINYLILLIKFYNSTNTCI